MAIRQWVRRFALTTPIQALLRKIERRPLGFRALNWLSTLERAFGSFDQAWPVARKNAGNAHGDPHLVHSNLTTSLATRPSDYPVLYWLNRIQTEGLVLFDYGGGAGQLFYQYSALLCPGLIREWIVMDLPEVVAIGVDVAQQRCAQGLRFSTSVRDCRGCDIFLASGAFHYWERTVRDLADETAELPPHFILNRSPFREDGDPFVGIQRGSTWAIPFLARTPSGIEREFSELGYELVDRWLVPEKTFSLALLPGHRSPYMGFYFRRSA